MNKIYIFFIIILQTGCYKDKEDNNNHKTKIASLFKKNIPQEYIDSLSVENFIQQYPDFNSYRNKLHKFYSRRNYHLAWSETGNMLPQADMFINLILNVDIHGITHYETDSLTIKYQEVIHHKKPHKEKISQTRKELDLLLTASYFQYSKHIWRGTVDTKNELVEWYIDRKKIKYGKTLDAILSDKSENPFFKFEPLHPEYQKLKILLSEYKSINSSGGWPLVSIYNKKNLQKGDSSPAVTILRKRLFLSKDLPILSSSRLFDLQLENAVKKFQQRHGLKEDGIVRDKTLRALNIPIQKRIEQIIINMERWRWVPEKINTNYVLVNIPEFRLHVFEEDMRIWSMNVIVGQMATRTPVFNDEIEYIVMSPYWNVPHSIATSEIIPMIIKDPLSIYKYDIEVLKNDQLVNPDSILWDSLSEQEARQYQFKQKPGRENALGNIKFLFPNKFDVYLHDTPQAYLFDQQKRDFSHGCIRIEDPLKFGEYLLRDNPDWTREKIQEAMNSGTEQFVKLKESLPIYIVYFTTWVDENGIPHFRDDLYKHDEKLAQVLF